jgi:NADPH:quinone reductase-like Zn-dependent oxidoreductase
MTCTVVPVIGGQSRARGHPGPRTKELVRLVADGRYRSTVTRCVAFDQVPDALSDLVARRTMGRVVVDVRS